MKMRTEPREALWKTGKNWTGNPAVQRWRLVCKLSATLRRCFWEIGLDAPPIERLSLTLASSKQWPPKGSNGYGALKAELRMCRTAGPRRYNAMTKSVVIDWWRLWRRLVSLVSSPPAGGGALSFIPLNLSLPRIYPNTYHPIFSIPLLPRLINTATYHSLSSDVLIWR